LGEPLALWYPGSNTTGHLHVQWPDIHSLTAVIWCPTRLCAGSAVLRPTYSRLCYVVTWHGLLFSSRPMRSLSGQAPSYLVDDIHLVTKGSRRELSTLWLIHVDVLFGLWVELQVLIMCCCWPVLWLSLSRALYLQYYYCYVSVSGRRPQPVHRWTHSTFKWWAPRV